MAPRQPREQLHKDSVDGIAGNAGEVIALEQAIEIAVVGHRRFFNSGLVS
jgi:hypothetical protein